MLAVVNSFIRASWKWVAAVLMLGLSFGAVVVLTSADHLVEQPELVSPGQAVQHVSAPRIDAGLDFAGTILPLERIGVRERMDRELLAGCFRHSTTILTLKRASRWFPLIEPILVDSGIPADFKYLAVIESGLSQAISPAGAKGFWQFMPDAAHEFGLEVNADVDERYHVEKATRAACAYLNEAHRRFGDWLMAAASYNMGMKGVESALEEQRGSSYWDLHLNRETARYVYRLFATKQIMADPEAHGFFLARYDLWGGRSSRDTLIDASISSLADFAAAADLSYNELKSLNPWLIADHLNVTEGRSYVLDLPLD
jgi:membrane-bound lytic murein transglycosylase D